MPVWMAGLRGVRPDGPTQLASSTSRCATLDRGVPPAPRARSVTSSRSRSRRSRTSRRSATCSSPRASPSSCSRRSCARADRRRSEAARRRHARATSPASAAPARLARTRRPPAAGDGRDPPRRATGLLAPAPRGGGRARAAAHARVAAASASPHPPFGPPRARPLTRRPPMARRPSGRRRPRRSALARALRNHPYVRLALNGVVLRALGRPGHQPVRRPRQPDRAARLRLRDHEVTARRSR